MTQENYSKPQGVWAWVLQRVSAVLLIVFLGTHLLVLHYVPENLIITFVGVTARFKNALYVMVDGGLLAIALYHGLNGLRGILFDYITNESARRAITWVLLVVGMAFLLWGAYALAAFTM